MMRKILVCLLAVASYNSFADTTSTTTSSTNKYSAFQQFDNEYNLGFAVTSGNLNNGSNTSTNNTQSINLEVERLFDVGVWMDVNAYLLTYYSQPSNTALGGNQVTGSQPNFGGVNATVGYAFPLVSDKLLITPYVTGGRNTNLSTYSLEQAGNNNLTSDYYWTFGGGARLEYRVNSVFDFYLDQNMLYNANQTPNTTANSAVGFPNSSDNYQYVTTLGAKFNLYRNFQLGAKAFYNNYYYTQTQTVTTPYGNGNAYAPQSSVGGMVTVGLTY